MYVCVSRRLLSGADLASKKGLIDFLRDKI
jgi:hypothetical protein